MIFLLNPNNFVRLLAKDWPIVYVVSNKPIVIYLGCYSNPKKSMIKATILCVL
jgi:hypothetical protein